MTHHPFRFGDSPVSKGIGYMRPGLKAGENGVILSLGNLSNQAGIIGNATLNAFEADKVASVKEHADGNHGSKKETLNNINTKKECYMTNSVSHGSFKETSFWEKVRQCFLKAGKHVMEEVLTLYFVWRDPDVPISAKASILTALVYFISPLDAIPDVLPVVGYSDDASVIAATLYLVRIWLKPEHHRQAQAIVKKFIT
jgi:uncharacterized membrane protein YkvA (DUF1232 family)